MLTSILQEYGLTSKEAQVYLICLEVGNAPVSTIARLSKENRVTVYSVLKNLVKQGIANEQTKDKTTYYSVISPEKLAKKMKDKYELIQNALPEFLAIANKYDNKPKVQFYDGFEGIKSVYEDIILSGKDMPKGEPFLTFAGISAIDPKLQEWLVKDFAPWRLKFPTKTKAIMSKNADSSYSKYHTKNHDTLIIDDPVFDFTNEIIVYGNNKTAILMYNSNELAGLIITSNTLHNGLKSMFNLIWNVYRKAKKK